MATTQTASKSARKPATKPSAKRATPAPARKPGTQRAAARKRAAPPAPAQAVAKPIGKLVRDSFTMPQQDFDLIDGLKKRALAFQRPTKKSELLRAGLQVLAHLDSAQLKRTLEALAPIKTGRPKKL
jgi:hypothetical protein